MQFQNLSLLPPEGIEKFSGKRPNNNFNYRTKNLKLSLNFQSVRESKKKSFCHKGGMDIFWNCAIKKSTEVFFSPSYSKFLFVLKVTHQMLR